MLKNGDYLPDGKGGFRRAEGREAVLQLALWKLTARRGQFPFLPRLGSRLYTLMREKPSTWEALARQYAAEALEDEGDLAVDGVSVRQEGDRLLLSVLLEWRGESLNLELEV